MITKLERHYRENLEKKDQVVRQLESRIRVCERDKMEVMFGGKKEEMLGGRVKTEGDCWGEVGIQKVSVD